ncbi:MAG: hypothetical protein ACLURP_01930 [Ruminococcus sp.]
MIRQDQEPINVSTGLRLKEGDSYLVARTITVTEKEPETQAAGDSGTEESGDSEDPDPLPEQPVSCRGSSCRRGKPGF